MDDFEAFKAKAKAQLEAEAPKKNQGKIFEASFKGGKPLGMTLNTSSGHCLVQSIDKRSQAEELDVRDGDYLLYVEASWMQH